VRTRFVTAAALALVACQRAETPEQAAARIQTETEAARPAVEAMMAAYGRHFTAGHTDSLASMYMDDAHQLPPNMPPVHGKEAIRQGLAAYFANGPIGELQFRVENLVVNGPIAIVRAAWTFTPPAGAPMPADTGVGMAHWHLADGQWMIAEEIWRSNLPAPPPPPAPRRRG